MFKDLFAKIKAYLKGRLLSRKQLHDSSDPANKAVEAAAEAVEAKEEDALSSAVTQVVAQEASKL